MAEYPLVRFVDSPAAAAAIRFDFNDVTPWVEHDGWSLGVPSLAGEPDGIGVEYGPRTLSFKLRVDGTKAAALTVMSALAKELLRQDNWLMFKLSPASETVWFKTYRSSPGDLSFEHVYTTGTRTDSWSIGVSLMADPFAFGARRSVGPFTVPNDPTAPNGGFFDVTGIVGDAPAPAMVVDANSSTGVRSFGVLAVRQHGTPSDHVSVKQAEACVLGADTTVPDLQDGASVPANAGNFARTSFTAQPAMTTRLDWKFPSTHTTEASRRALTGKFRVFVKLRRSDATSVFFVGVSLGVFNTSVQLPLTADNIIVDLGVVSTQEATAPGYGSSPSPVEASVNMIVLAERLSGTGFIDWDFILMVPADEQYLSWLSTVVDSTTVDLLVDGESERMLKFADGADPFSPATAIRTRDVVSVTGGFPDLLPDRVNRFYAVIGTYATSPPRVGWSKATTETFTVHYFPRYLWLGSQ